MLSDADMFERMSKGWRAGMSDGTICGNGSTMAHTANVRQWLPKVVGNFEIKRMVDAGAGDLHWIHHAKLTCQYFPFDLIPRKPEVGKIDITTELLPKSDAILCRMVLNHLDETRIEMALALFRQTSKYLIATQFNGEDLPQRSPQFTRLDLRKAPYNLGEPLASVQDGSEQICSLAIWKL